jgi:hypothetical protein
VSKANKSVAPLTTFERWYLAEFQGTSTSSLAKDIPQATICFSLAPLVLLSIVKRLITNYPKETFLMSAIVYSEALRIIGEDLDLRGIKTFFIRCEADLFVVDGGYQSPPAPTPVSLYYAANDIEQLDRKARERNDHLSVVKDFLSLSRTLWAMATYVLAKGGRLLNVSNNASTERMPAVNIEYETAQGDRVVDNLTGSAIYELCISVYKLRGTSNITSSRYTRFSTLQESN